MVSCTKDDRVLPLPVPEVSLGLYVMNEGVWGMNNSMITYYDMSSFVAVPDFFRVHNGRGLGDLANDLKLYGSKLYCVVSGSGQLEVLNPETGKSLARVSFIGEEGISREPRAIAFHRDKAYVCCFDGTVARLDTASLQIEARVSVGANPDGICVANGKLYVSNSGGSNYPNFDNQVSVVDIASFKEIRRITVGLNPFKLEVNALNQVYVLCRGNYSSVGSSLVRIDALTDEVSAIYPLDISNFTISGEYLYFYSVNWITGEVYIRLFHMASELVAEDSWIADGTVLSAPYGIAVDKNTGDVYLGDAGIEYGSNGKVYCFSEAGILKRTLDSHGVGPAQIVIRYP